MKQENLKITKEVLTKIANKIVQKNTNTGITHFVARITQKQMDWLNKVYKMETGKNILNRINLSIDVNGMEYGLPNKPIDRFGNYVIKIFPCDNQNMQMLENMINKNF